MFGVLETTDVFLQVYIWPQQTNYNKRNYIG